MDATAGPAPAPAARRRADGDPRAARVFAGDVRIALAGLNEVRLIALKRAFGVSRAQADALTFVLALTAADATLRTAGRIGRAGLPQSGDALLGAFLVREAALGVAGPAARKFPLAGTFLAAAMAAGIALPELRRAAHGLRSAERGVRAQRMRTYAAAAGRARRAPAPAA